MKKIFSLFLSCILILPICSKVTALDNTSAIDSERVSSILNNAEAFLMAAGFQNTIDTSIPMYNLNDEIEALYYPLQPIGYLIASYKDGHVIEFSPDVQRFTDISGKLYYNGVLEYYREVDHENLIQVPSNTMLKKTDLQIVYNNTPLEQIPLIEYSPSVSTYGLEPNNPTPIHYVEWHDDYHCVITAVTNLLQYYHDFMNADVYASNVNSVTSLRKYLNEGGSDAGYVYGGGTFLTVIAGRHNYSGNIYSGLQAYFNRSDVDSYKVNAFATGKIHPRDIKTQLNTYARPVVLTADVHAVDPNYPEDGGHAVLAYTYMETGETTYFITNDGWGSNYAYICADDITSNLGALYLS